MSRKNLLWMRFHRLTVTEEVGKSKIGEALWKCVCDCGNTKIITTGNLWSGRVYSCGCYNRELAQAKSDKRLFNLIGQKFGRLLVIKNTGKIKHTCHVWECLCDCGNIHHVPTVQLTQGHTKSCGCLRKEKAKKLNWKQDRTDKSRQDTRQYQEYTEWRKAVYARDSYTCQKCFSRKGGTLNAHHIESYAKNKDLRVSLDNGITLCKKCHKNLHHVYGSITNRDNLLEFLGVNENE